MWIDRSDAGRPSSACGRDLELFVDRTGAVTENWRGSNDLY
jgi:hypothetical protein